MNVAVTKISYYNHKQINYAILTLYKMMMLKNCMRLYSAMYFISAKLVINAHLPSRIKSTMQDMLSTLEVKGAATLASPCERDTPTYAALSACKYMIMKKFIHELNLTDIFSNIINLTFS